MQKFSTGETYLLVARRSSCTCCQKKPGYSLPEGTHLFARRSWCAYCLSEIAFLLVTRSLCKHSQNELMYLLPRGIYFLPKRSLCSYQKELLSLLPKGGYVLNRRSLSTCSQRNFWSSCQKEFTCLKELISCQKGCYTFTTRSSLLLLERVYVFVAERV